MASQLHWPNKYYFYPLGNTPAVCLTRDFPPGVPATILLLGCGDPRNVLYTVFCDRQVSRKLDFTCCDWDLGVLARNALLFSLILDNKPHDRLWNIFYHTYLDLKSKDLLVAQCRRLIEIAETPESWRLSPYGGLVRFSTDHTLAEVRRFWKLYADMDQLPKGRYDTVVTKFRSHCEQTLKERSGIHFGRGAGPFISRTPETYTAIFDHFWETGVTAGTDASKATLLNATFIYSRGEEATSLHYGQVPIASFHLATAFSSAAESPTPAQIVRVAKTQFAAWCDAFRVASAKHDSDTPVVRLIWGDALAVSSSLRTFAETRSCQSGTLYAQWSAEPIRLSAVDYILEDAAPTTFDVVDTSNLTDHLGLLNLLIAIEPILASFHSVLYTEALTAAAGLNAAEYSLKLLKTDFSTMALLLDLCPADFLSGLTTRSNVDEVVSLNVFRGQLGGGEQFQQGLTWRRPASCDMFSNHELVAFNHQQLAALFYAFYRELFDKNELNSISGDMLKDPLKLFTSSQETRYTYETFVLFLKVVCDKHQLDATSRADVLHVFLKLIDSSFNPMSTAGLHRQELYMYLFRFGLYQKDIFRMDSPRIGRFASWDCVPDMVRIVLVVPRAKLGVFEGARKMSHVESISELAAMATVMPPVQGLIQSKEKINVFSTIHVVFGTTTSSGTSAHPEIIIREDPRGWLGESPLLVSFAVSARILNVLNDPKHVNVAFAIKMTTRTMLLSEKLGPALVIHQAPFMDRTQVHVLPEASLLSQGATLRATPQQPPTASPSPSLLSQELGLSSVSVQLNNEANRVKKLVGHVSVDKSDAKRSLQTSGVNPSVSQISPCTVRLSLAGRSQDVAFPHPVVGHNHNIKIARKSSYIEVIVPLSAGLDPDGMAMFRFPVIRSQPTGSMHPWGIHRVNLSDLPSISSSTDTMSWLQPHVSLAMSAREALLRERGEKDVMMFVKDTIHSLFGHIAGAQGASHRIFQLLDESSQNFSDSVLFVDSMRHDLPSSTVVCHAYILPLTRGLAPRVRSALLRASEGGIVNIKIYEGEANAWKRLFPAFAERCRTWEHAANCEYVSQGCIPLSTEQEQDPLCSCGRGKDVEGSIMLTRPGLKDLAPHVTRIAISPIFSVSYLEPLRDFSAMASHFAQIVSGKCGRCSRTGGKGGGDLKTCSRCHVVKYCSAECQRADWKSHKALCRHVSSSSQK